MYSRCMHGSWKICVVYLCVHASLSIVQNVQVIAMILPLDNVNNVKGLSSL